MPPPNILVVEDDEGPRASLGAILTAEGYEVAPAADAREALNLLATGLRPALILLDMIGPNVDGWRFMALRRIDPELDRIPVVVMTGLTVASDEWARSLGAVLRKPIDSARLLELVRQYCSA